MTVSKAQLKISDSEHLSRCERLLEYLQTEKLAGVVVFDSDYILYYTGFAFIPTERPMAFLMNAQGRRALFVPRLEVEHARANALVDDVAFYLEYPGDPHPMAVLAEALDGLGMKTGSLGADGDGYPWILGYRGPRLSEVGAAAVVPIRAFIEDQMAIKSP
ncbi:MAG: aminopeptidase P family protein, partial [Chloroflexi bacterium]|nr:aminopeptidase P family protein [Chloroflexota bacterium]